jgi:DisA bacterial checkpoint controller nucleotide-binding
MHDSMSSREPHRVAFRPPDLVSLTTDEHRDQQRVRQTISQFMWGYQRPFRVGIEFSAKSAFRAIGAGVDPQALLVGFRATDQASFDRCIEPENDLIAQADLSEVESRARELYGQHEDFGLRHSVPGVHEARHRALQDRLRGEALCEALARSEAGRGRRFFASTPQLIENYDIYAVVGVVAHRWDELPTLTTRGRDRVNVASSLPEAVMLTVLSYASQAMSRRVPPIGFADESGTETADILRLAARRFVHDVARLSEQWLGSQLHEHLDAVAALPYEGRAGSGTIVLAADNAQTRSDDLEVVVSFRTPIEISETRAFRKVVEMSGQSLHVLSDGERAYGLGRIRDTYDAAKESVFHLTVIDRSSWNLRHGETVLLEVENGQPRLPRDPLSKFTFNDTVQRLFPEATDTHVAALWDLARAAQDQPHGTMLVVHRDAAGEAIRLAPQALAIEPTLLSREHLRAITNIDGAVLVAPDGLCHAAGVILDGQATGHGDQARGARYNSAVRYRHAARDDCLVIIVSEDGMIDLLPDLMPRVAPRRIEEAVCSLEAAATGQVNFEKFYRARDHVLSLSFYLSGEQCDRVNAATNRVEDYREANSASSLRFYSSGFEPNPDMNATFLLPD